MSQSKRHAYRPAVNEELEHRLVLSGVGRLPSVLVSGLTPKLRSVGKTRHPPITALVNQAFDSFVQDFTQARSTYLSSRPADAAAGMRLSGAFKSYTRNRVNLLAQQLISTGLQSTAKPSKQQHGPGLTIPLVINRRIINTKTGETPQGTLARILNDSTPMVGDTPGAIALASLAQDQAIEAARVSVLNGFAVIKNGNGGTKTKLD